MTRVLVYSTALVAFVAGKLQHLSPLSITYASFWTEWLLMGFNSDGDDFRCHLHSRLDHLRYYDSTRRPCYENHRAASKLHQRWSIEYVRALSTTSGLFWYRSVFLFHVEERGLLDEFCGGVGAGHHCGL